MRASRYGPSHGGRAALQPEDQTRGVAAIITTASAPATRVERRPAAHWSSSTKSCVTAMTCSASAAKSTARSAGVATAIVFHSDR